METDSVHRFPGGRARGTGQRRPAPGGPGAHHAGSAAAARGCPQAACARRAPPTASRCHPMCSFGGHFRGASFPANLNFEAACRAARCGRRCSSLCWRRMAHPASASRATARGASSSPQTCVPLRLLRAPHSLPLRAVSAPPADTPPLSRRPRPRAPAAPHSAWGYFLRLASAPRTSCVTSRRARLSRRRRRQ
jgi:hypothetical protein